MRFVYLLEDDPKFQKEICEALHQIDPKLQVRLFNDLEGFVDWMRLLMTKGADALVEGGSIPTFIPSEPVPPKEAHELVLVISKVEILNSQHLNLIKKTKDTFIKKKICRIEDPTAFVLTAFDNHEFKVHDLQDMVIHNVIFKPFDRLILSQHLTFAVDGRHPPSKYTIQNQKTSSVIEMLKEIQMEGISMCGFITQSDREIVSGVPAKYYGDFFKTERQKSVIAVSRDCMKHPTDNGAYRCNFTFFGMDQAQITTLRKKLSLKEHVPMEFDWLASEKKKSPTHDVNVVIIDEEEGQDSGLKGTIARHYENVKFTVYESITEFLGDLDPTSLVPKSGTVPTISHPQVVVVFDAHSGNVLSFENSNNEPLAVFGVNEADIKKNPQFFQQRIVSEHKDKLKKIILGKPDREQDLVCKFHEGENTFLVRIDGLSKDNSTVKVKISEPPKEEQIRWFMAQSKLPQRVDAILINHKHHFGETARERWMGIIESLKKRANLPLEDRGAKLFIISIKDYSDQDKREMSKYVADIFFKPVDRVYFLQKFHFWFPNLKFKQDAISMATIAQHVKMKTAMPIVVNELSEAGVVLKYNRSMQVGSFREFVLWQPYEVGAPELLANCNYIEEITNNNVTEFNHHFVFFGINDYFLKHIRVWIRDNYISSKESSG